MARLAESRQAVWAYERSAQEYLTIRQALAEPDPLRLAWRALIKRTIKDVVLQRPSDPVGLIARHVGEAVPAEARDSVQALIIEELRRLHEGVLARYGLRPSDLLEGPPATLSRTTSPAAESRCKRPTRCPREQRGEEPLYFRVQGPRRRVPGLRAVA